MDPDTPQWLENLDQASSRRPEALTQLHQLLLRAAHAELSRRRGRHSLAGPERDDLADQAADHAMLSIVAKLGQFRGKAGSPPGPTSSPSSKGPASSVGTTGSDAPSRSRVPSGIDSRIGSGSAPMTARCAGLQDDVRRRRNCAPLLSLTAY